MFKKLRGFQIVLALAVVASPLFAAAPVFAFAGGNGSSGSPFQVATCADLISVHSDLTAYYKLTADIDCSAAPFSNSVIRDTFTGSFDGQGHSVSGIAITAASTDYVGLFSKIGSNAVVKNLSVYADVNASAEVGIVAGQVLGNGAISRVDTHGSVDCGNNCAGIAGNIRDTASVSRSWSDADIGGVGYTYGGIVGYAHDGSPSLLDVYYTGTVDPNGGTEDNVGGIVGFAESLTLTRGYSDGSVDGGHYVGGIAGEAVTSHISATFTTMHVNGVGVGPIFGGEVLPVAGVNYFDSTATPGLTADMDADSVAVSGTSSFKQSSAAAVFSTWSFGSGNVWQIEYQDYPALTPIRDPYMVCEAPDSTDTTITGHCLIEPRGWGIPTWEARWQKKGASTWTSITLADSHVAQATVTGLTAGTTYYLQYRYTNTFGTGSWGALEILTTGTAPADPATNSSDTATTATVKKTVLASNVSDASDYDATLNGSVSETPRVSPVQTTGSQTDAGSDDDQTQSTSSKPASSKVLPVFLGIIALALGAILIRNLFKKIK